MYHSIVSEVRSTVHTIISSPSIFKSVEKAFVYQTNPLVNEMQDKVLVEFANLENYKLVEMCEGFFQEIGKKASTLYDCCYLDQKEIQLCLQNLKGHVKNFPLKKHQSSVEISEKIDLVFHKTKQLIRLLKNLAPVCHSLLNNDVEAHITNYFLDLHVFHYLILPCTKEEDDYQYALSKLKIIYAHKNKFLYEKLLSTWYNNTRGALSLLLERGLEDREIIAMSPHLKRLYISRGNDVAHHSVRNALTRFNNIQNFILNAKEGSFQWFEAIASLTKLRELSIYDAQDVPSVLKNASQLTTLQKLALASCSVHAGFDLSILSHLSALQKLSFQNFSWTIDFQSLKLLSLTAVQTLKLNGCPELKDADLALLPKSLKNLSLQNCGKITDQGCKELGRLTLLTKLRLFQQYKITDVGLQELYPLNQLKVLDLNFCDKIKEFKLHSFAQLEKLSLLGLVTDSKLRSLPPLLKCLNLSHCSSITDLDLNQLLSLTELQKLFVRGSSTITCQGLLNLTALPKLKEIHVSKTTMHTELMSLKTDFKDVKIVVYDQ